MIWSGFYEDFDWCKQEFAKLETMQNLKRGFRYVIARIDEFGDFGPRGNEAVDRFFQTARGSRWQRAAFAAVWAEGQPLPPVGGIAHADVLRGGGSNRDEEDLRGDYGPSRVEGGVPKALRPKQLRGLALARSGQTMKAQLVLGKLYAAGEIDPETLGILARTWMDWYNQSGDPLFLLKSRDLYRQAFEAFPTDYYTGINAASKSLLAGEKETAAQLAARLQKIVGDKPVANDYWMTATAAELQLLPRTSLRLPCCIGPPW